MSLRALLVVTHLLGAGHLARAAALAEALAAAGHDVVLVTGGRPSPLIQARGARVVQLPPVCGTVDDLRTLRDETGIPVGSDRLAARRALLLSTLATVRPDILVTELFPFGRRALSAEFLALLDAATELNPRPVVAASVRDILVAPDTHAKRAATLATVRNRYDAVLVHGDPTLIPLEASWPDAGSLGGRLHYTGYIDGGSDGRCAKSDPDGEIVVSGGSSAAGLPLYRAALGAARALPVRRWRILVGHGVPDESLAGLAAATPPNAVVERARPDFRHLLSGAALFVGQSGYNTAMDIVATGVRAVLVPFEGGRETEQRLRADWLARRGVATVLPEAELGPGSLADSVRRTLSAPRSNTLALLKRDGASRSAAILASLAQGRDLGTNHGGEAA